MSNAIFPNMPLICAGMEITSVWSTQKSSSPSGRQFVLGKRVYPTYNIKIPFTVLRSNAYFAEYEALRGFFNARKGDADDFLFKIPFENTVTNQPMGLGDGVTTAFSFLRSVGGFVDEVGGVDSGTLVVKVNGTTTSVTVSADLSKAIFSSAPANLATITWSCSYYVRARFVKDSLTFKAFSKGLYSTSCEIETFRP